MTHSLLSPQVRGESEPRWQLTEVFVKEIKCHLLQRFAFIYRDR